MNTGAIMTTYFNHEKRIGRMSYFLRTLAIYAIGFFAAFILRYVLSMVGVAFVTINTLAFLLIGIPVVVFMIYQTIQRQNDRGLDWYWAILLLIPVVGVIWWLFLVIVPGKNEPVIR